MKRFLCALLAVVLLLGSLPVSGQTAEPTFSFALTVDGQAEKAVSAGDIVTVTVTLRKQDGQEPYPMYAMQNEICYDSSFFRLVEDSIQTVPGVVTADLALGGTGRAFYINYLSFGGGALWEPVVQVGNFQLEVIGTTGVSRISNRNSMVCKADGAGSYPVVCRDATAVLSQTCRVTFDALGGSSVAAQDVPRGASLAYPAEPRRPGYRFAGWCIDLDCTRRWMFSETPVTENLCLYAKWEKDDGAIGYSDVWERDWFFPSVRYVSEQGLMSGLGDGRFAPEAQTSRAMIVTILWRLAGEPASGAPMTFADVPAGQWYTEAVRWAAHNGIVNGYSEERFAPDAAITREQLASILYRYAGDRGYDCSTRAELSRFSDAGQVQSWAVEAIRWANAAGLINGVGDDRLEPQATATRGQTAAILHRFCTTIT